MRLMLMLLGVVLILGGEIVYWKWLLTYVGGWRPVLAITGAHVLSALVCRFGVTLWKAGWE